MGHRIRHPQPNVETLCMTRLGHELNTWFAKLGQSGDLPNGAIGFRQAGPFFTVQYERGERLQVGHSVIRAYVKALRGGFLGRHTDLDQVRDRPC